MMRVVALLAAVLVSLAGPSLAQEPQPEPAPEDTIAVPQMKEPPPAVEDTVAAPTVTEAPPTREFLRGDERLSLALSVAIGSAYNYNPESFHDNFDPSFGLLFDVGVRKWMLEASASFDYNFFFFAGTEPNDLNILMLFGNLKVRPLESTARPYILVCGGYFRSWIVDATLPSGDEYTEGVLGFGGGAGVEIEVDELRRIFLEGRYIQGRTRKTTEQKRNTELIPFRLGFTWAFQL